MKILLALFLSLSANAEVAVFNLNGKQHIQKMEPGEQLCDECKVQWDERKDGKLPEGAVAGYIERYEVDVEKTRLVCKKDKEGKVILKRIGLRTLADEPNPCETEEQKYIEKEPRVRVDEALKAIKERDDAEAEAKEAAARVKKENLASMAERIRSGKPSPEDEQMLKEAILEKLGL